MARLNYNRESTADSLYGGRATVDSSRASTPGEASDKENSVPHSRTQKPVNPAVRQMAQQNNPSRSGLRDASPHTHVASILSQHPRKAESEKQKFFNPDQDDGLRRDLRAAMRDNHRDIRENRDDYMKQDGTKLLMKRIELGNELMNGVRRTDDAVVDSRFLVDTAELSSKKVHQEAFGSGSLGLDVDTFVQRCINFMNLGGVLDPDSDDETAQRPTQAQPQTQRRRRRTAVIDDDEDPSGEPMAWDVLGSQAAFLANRRPACPSFLLGPLNSEKKFRNTQKTTRSQRRDVVAQVVRPDIVNHEELGATENTNVTKMCNGIKARLTQLLEEGDKAVNEEANEDMSEDEAMALFKKHHLAMNWEVSLIRFCFHPTDFGQTVENIFYLSFLIRDGYIRLGEDDDGNPTIRTDTPKDASEHVGSGTARHQAILSLDYSTWRTLVKAYGITECLIPHRTYGEQVTTATGWYA